MNSLGRLSFSALIKGIEKTRFITRVEEESKLQQLENCIASADPSTEQHKLLRQMNVYRLCDWKKKIDDVCLALVNYGVVEYELYKDIHRQEVLGQLVIDFSKASGSHLTDVYNAISNRGNVILKEKIYIRLEDVKIVMEHGEIPLGTYYMEVDVSAMPRLGTSNEFGARHTYHSTSEILSQVTSRSFYLPDILKFDPKLASVLFSQDLLIEAITGQDALSFQQLIEDRLRLVTTLYQGHYNMGEAFEMTKRGLEQVIISSFRYCFKRLDTIPPNTIKLIYELSSLLAQIHIYPTGIVIKNGNKVNEKECVIIERIDDKFIYSTRRSHLYKQHELVMRLKA